jgi:hypothetical protein
MGDGMRGSAGDPAAMLGIPGPGIRVLLIAYGATIITLAATAGGEPMRSWTGALALAITLVAAVVATGPGPYPLSPGMLVVLVPVPAIAAALIDVGMVAPGPPGYTAWHILSGTLLLLVVAVRGRIGWAWAGFALMTVVNVAWAAMMGRPPIDGIALEGQTTAVLVAGSLFAFGLGRQLRSLEAYRIAELTRIQGLEATLAELDERADRLAEFDSVARDPLTALAEGERPDARTRSSLRALESELRDRLRGRAFAPETLRAAARLVRERGVELTLLDDLAPAELDAAASVRLAHRVSHELSRILSPEDRSAPLPAAVTFRLFAGADSEPRLSIAIEGPAGSVRSDDDV